MHKYRHFHSRCYAFANFSTCVKIFVTNSKKYRPRKHLSFFSLPLPLYLVLRLLSRLYTTNICLYNTCVSGVCMCVYFSKGFSFGSGRAEFAVRQTQWC